MKSYRIVLAALGLILLMAGNGLGVLLLIPAIIHS
jgi:hypothetical protein